MSEKYRLYVNNLSVYKVKLLYNTSYILVTPSYTVQKYEFSSRKINIQKTPKLYRTNF